MALLEIRNLSVDFETAGGKFRAVDSVDINCEHGEILSIVGESGSGKSVAMLALMGLLPWTATVTADRMSFHDTDMLTISDRARRRIGPCHRPSCRASIFRPAHQAAPNQFLIVFIGFVNQATPTVVDCHPQRKPPATGAGGFASDLPDGTIGYSKALAG